ncbi:F-box/FBD/LRR-repeat protein At1g78750-like [Setaria viridis]|uniref:F-box/FBD/LRR-repeat protein At1g78750-like n=1 Tax=Setaria viridis TaxID=4556 RepID=UPI003B3A2E90
MSGGSIDALPDDILEHILGFLPAPEAVRTCVIARRWRNLWKHGTGLRITCIADDVEAMETVKEHQKFGDHLLRLRGHTPLETCYLRFSNFYDDDDALLNRWFWHVVTCRVRMFRLENICLDGFDLEGMPLISQHWMSLDLIGVKKTSYVKTRPAGVNDNNICVFLEGLLEAENLAFISESTTFVFGRDLKQCPTFSKLWTLVLNDHWCVAPDFPALTCILKHSSILEKLTLQLFSKGPQHKIEMIGRSSSMDRSVAISENLKEIEIKCEVVDEEVHKVLKFLCSII